jgi:inositol-phosphate phosphatase/L-galactose 1-phosphate phosphatase/histidinol-phosphatase
MAVPCTATQQELCKPEFIRVAHELADAAAAVTSRYFRTPVPVDVKSDASPVTVADREAEAAMRQLLAQRFPEHSIFGEEQGYQQGSGSTSDGSYLWVIDPIDGTKSFITGAAPLKHLQRWRAPV